ncbi:MAG: hypothetical protein ACHQAY_24840, partial [Hyphomicrobiales bacterium]
MSFDDTLGQAIDMLRRHKRVSYRALRRQFSIGDAYVEDLKSEIIEVLKLGVDEDGKVLVWIGAEAGEASPAVEAAASPSVNPAPSGKNVRASAKDDEPAFESEIRRARCSNVMRISDLLLSGRVDIQPVAGTPVVLVRQAGGDLSQYVDIGEI